MSGIRTRLHHLADHYLILALLCSLIADTSTCSIKVLILLDTKMLSNLDAIEERNKRKEA